MIKIQLFFALILVSLSSFAENEKRFNIKYGANSGGFGFGPAIEYKINKNITLGLLYETITLTLDTTTSSSTGKGINARYYFNEALTQDIYLHASFITGSAEAKNEYAYAKLSDINSINLTFGKTWMWENFNLDASIGVRKFSTNEIETVGYVDTTALNSLKGLGLSGSFTIGYAF